MLASLQCSSSPLVGREVTGTPGLVEYLNGPTCLRSLIIQDGNVLMEDTNAVTDKILVS